MSETCEIVELKSSLFDPGEPVYEPCGYEAVGTCESGLLVCHYHQREFLQLQVMVADGTLGIPRTKGKTAP